MTAYYNEIEPYAAAWLRNLIDAGHIAPGVVDERDIRDILPSELAGYTQCHFFAGIGVWSYALRLAGWPDDRPVWTGSCPCQPFSSAGKGTGFDDERHLWPAWHHLIKERRPAILFGEQVASSDAGPWIDLVHDDMEALDYAFGAIPFPSAGVGAPHIRDRLYWVADTNGAQPRITRGARGTQAARLQSGPHLNGRGAPDPLADTEAARWAASRLDRALGRTPLEPDRHGAAVVMANAEQSLRGREAATTDHEQAQSDGPADRASGRGSASSGMGNSHGRDEGPIRRVSGWSDAESTRGFWGRADWLACRDGKWRPIEPGTEPLVTGAPARVGRLRAYGNAINAEAARVFIEACK